MNKTKIVLYILLSLFLFFVFYLIITSLTKPKKQPQPEYPLTVVDIIRSIQPNIGFQSVDKGVYILSPNFKFSENTPTQSSFYKYDKSQFNDAYFYEILRKLNLKVESVDTSENEGRIISAQNGDVFAAIYTDRNEMNYTDPVSTTVPLINFPDAISIDTYKQEAEQFLLSAGIDTSRYEYTNFAYLNSNGTESIVVDTPAQANLLQLIYKAKIDGKSLIDNQANLDPNMLEVRISADKTVKRFYVQFVGITQKQAENYPLKNDTKVKNEIIAGIPKLIYADTPISENILNTVVDKAELAYYAVNGNLVPVYVLTGTSTTVNANKGASQSLLDAVYVSDAKNN